MEFAKNVDPGSYPTSRDSMMGFWNKHFSKYPQVILMKWFNNHIVKRLAIELYFTFQIWPLMVYSCQNGPGEAHTLKISKSSFLPSPTLIASPLGIF